MYYIYIYLRIGNILPLVSWIISQLSWAISHIHIYIYTHILFICPIWSRFAENTLPLHQVFNHGCSPKSISITNKYRTDCLPYIDRFIHHLLTYHVYWRAGSSQIYSPSNRIQHPKIYYFMGFQPTIHMAGSWYCFTYTTYIIIYVCIYIYILYICIYIYYCIYIYIYIHDLSIKTSIYRWCSHIFPGCSHENLGKWQRLPTLMPAYVASGASCPEPPEWLELSIVMGVPQ